MLDNNYTLNDSNNNIDIYVNEDICYYCKEIKFIYNKYDKSKCRDCYISGLCL